jgi:3-hydroxyacyl-CoA dehydrogenase
MYWADNIEGLTKIVAGLKQQENRMKPEFSFSRLLLEKAEKGEKFTR